MLKSSLCDYSDAFIPNTGASAALNNRKNIIIENCGSFTDCISEVNITQIDRAKDIDVVMPMDNLVEYSNNYSKTSGCLLQYYRDEPALYNAGAIIDFPADGNYSAQFKFKQKITSKTGNDGTKKFKIMVPLKHVSIFGKLLKCH